MDRVGILPIGANDRFQAPVWNPVMGFRIGRHIRNIQNSTLSMPERQRRRRSGGKRWDIRLHATKRRERFEPEWPGTVGLILALVTAAAILIMIGLGW